MPEPSRRPRDDGLFPASDGDPRAVSLLALTVLSAALMELRAVLAESSLLFPYQGPDLTITIPARSIRRAPLIFALIPILPVVLICVVGFHQHWWRIVRLQSRQEALRELAVSAQLAALRAQVNPHFLFNSLNSIAWSTSTTSGRSPPGSAARYKLLMRNPTASEVELSRARARVLRRRMHW